MAVNASGRKIKNRRAAKIILSHEEDCDCLTCRYGICLSPLHEDKAWPEDLPPNSHQLAVFFTVDPRFKAPFLSWVADRLCLPVPSPEFLHHRELNASTNQSIEVPGNLLELFREYANETDATHGLAFKNISIPIDAVRRLLREENREALHQINTADEFVQWYYL
jgi:hypothetical protein